MTPQPNLKRRTSLVDLLSNLSIRPLLPSLRSRASTTTSFNQTFYAVHQPAMFLTLLKDAELTDKLLEYIADSPNGRRSLSRLARICKAVKEPALDILWRDLDSFVPLLSLFPSGLMRRARRPGLGLAKNPEPADWEKLLAYGERVRSVTYVEAYNNVSPSIFPVIEDLRPKQFVLPNLTSLIWKAETPVGLERSLMFMNPGLESLTIEMGAKSSKMSDFLNQVMARTSLSSFSFTLHSNLPDNFVETMQPNTTFEKLALMAPGALAARVGKWASGLPFLRSFSLDLSNRTTTAVEGFFDDITPGSGYSTPSSVGGTDSGVFSGDELDFSDFRKSVARLTSDGPRHGAFMNLQHIQLTGDTSNVATFLKHITSPLTQIDLVIEDPPAKDDWQDVCTLICDQFSDTLLSLRISATSNSRFAELVRSTSRGGEAQLHHLPLEHFAFLPHLQRLEIDLPESAVFHNRDIAHIARVCPNLEVLRLCGSAKFPPSFGPPFLTLEGIIPLTMECRRLSTLSVVVNAIEGRPEIFRTREVCSRTLQRLNVGHSWIKDPLQTAVLLSHLAPHLDALRWFSQTTRAGTVEANAAAWQKVSDLLPHLQAIRLSERGMLPKEYFIEPPIKVDAIIDATPVTINRGISAVPKYVDQEVEAFPEVADVGVSAAPETASVSIDATPTLVDTGISAIPSLVDQSVEAFPPIEEVPDADTIRPSLTASIAAFLPAVDGLVAIPARVVKIYTYYLALPLLYMLSFAPSMPPHSNQPSISEDEPKSAIPGGIDEEVSEKIMQSMEAPMPHTMRRSISIQKTEVSPVCQ